jgi:hypothetical protein
MPGLWYSPASHGSRCAMFGVAATSYTIYRLNHPPKSSLRVGIPIQHSYGLRALCRWCRNGLCERLWIALLAILMRQFCQLFSFISAAAMPNCSPPTSQTSSPCLLCAQQLVASPPSDSDAQRGRRWRGSGCSYGSVSSCFSLTLTSMDGRERCISIG